MIKLLDILKETAATPDASIVKEEPKGLWANINAKHKRGEKPARKGSEAFKKAVAAGEKIKKMHKECDDCERTGTDWGHGPDHEASMADAELRDLISNASKLQNMIEPGDELPGWASAYITLAADYMHSVAEYMEGKGAEMNQASSTELPAFAVYETKRK